MSPSLKHLQEEAAPLLANALVQHFLDRRLDQVLEPSRLLGHLQVAVTGWDDAALATLVDAEWARMHGAWELLNGTPAQQFPPGLLPSLSAVLKEPSPLDPVLLTAVLDQPAIRAILKEMLGTAVTNFAKRASTGVSGMPGGGAVKAAVGFMRTGVTGAILGAVGEGLGAEAERRVRDFVEEASTTALQQAIARLCDPKQEPAYGALRAAMLDSATSQPLVRWVKQIHRLHPAVRALRVIQAIRATVGTPEFEAWFTRHLAILTAPDATLRAFLQRAGVLEPVSQAVAEFLAEEAQVFLESSHFVNAWSDLGDAPATTKSAKAEKPAKTDKPVKARSKKA